MMNVTRGLFRLWVVGAVLWAIGVGGSTWWAYPKPNVVPTDPALLARLSAVSCPPSILADDFDALTKACNARHRYRETGNWFDENDRRMVSKEEFREAQAKYWREALSSAALVGIIPSIAVLIIGASLVWAVRGFIRDA
jgi:hypothetical protein